MAGSPEKTLNRVVAGTIRLLPVFLLVLMTASCSRDNVMIISDPYVEAAGEGSWMPAERNFRLASRLRGFPSGVVTIGKPEELSEIVRINAPNFGIFVVSPYHMGHLPVAELTGKRIIVAGGYPAPGFEDFEFVRPDRIGAIEQMGRLAAETPVDQGSILLVVNRNTEVRNGEFSAFTESFTRSGGEPDRIDVIDIARDPQRSLPEDLADRAGTAGLLVLLSASHNTAAIQATEEAGTPVMTEQAFGTGLETDRIIASIEVRDRDFRRALLSQIAGNRDEGAKYYPAMLRRK